MLMNGRLGLDYSSYEMWRKANNGTNVYSFIAPDWNKTIISRIAWGSFRVTDGLWVDPSYAPCVQSVTPFLDGRFQMQPYFRLKPAKGTAVSQVQLFLKNRQMVPNRLPDLIDVEIGQYESAGSWYRDEVQTALTYHKSEMGEDCEFYSAPGVIKQFFKPTDTWLNNYGINMANYSVAFPSAPLPILPTSILVWQLAANADALSYGIVNPPGWSTVLGVSMYIRFDL